MTSPLISIVLPTFNGSRFLTQSIASCIHQTFKSWELLVVDDASTDETATMVESYCKRDLRINCIRNTTNRKLPATLNTGFSQAQGTYFTWISDDNRFHPDTLGIMVDALEKTGMDAVYAGMDIINDNGVFLRHQPARPIHALGFRGNVVGACFLYGRKLHEAIGGFPDDLFLAEDYYFWLRAADSFRIQHLPLSLYDYREHPASLSSRHPNRRAEGQRALQQALQHIRSRELRAGIYTNLALDKRTEGDIRASFRYLAHAFRTAPLATLRYAPLRFLLMGY